MARWRNGMATGLAAMGLIGCGKATLPMIAGEPVTVKRGYCFVDTRYEQRGEERNREDTLLRVAHYEHSAPHVSTGNSLAIGSIVAAVVGTSGMLVGSLGMQDGVDMDRDLATGLFIGGLAVGVAGWGLCIASDGQYAAAVETYNEHLHRPGAGAKDWTNEGDGQDEREPEGTPARDTESPATERERSTDLP